MFSSKTDNWATPQDLFDNLDNQFGFTLDPCADHKNHKCDKYFTVKENGLRQSWKNETVFMNPPYGREIDKWVQKAYTEALSPGTLCVCLLPARTDTKWFHRYCVRGTIWFLKGRLKFGESENSAPFPSMVVIFGENYWNLTQLDNDSIHQFALWGLANES
jgi:site-specific DNA-methyltransferase (adenine-specific)